MPVSKHYGGHGREVMSKMKSKYGEEKGERVFYATENKRKQKSHSDRPSLRALRKAVGR